MTDARRVAVLSTGGTISMATGADGRRAALGDGSAGVAGIDHVTIEQVSVANVGSASITWPVLRRVLDEARRALDGGADGVVVTHGTDTLEESAFALDLVWDRPEPLVLTGAMRPGNAPGADGPANVRDAVATALSPAARGLGVLAVLDGEAHTARAVAKVRSQRIAAFESEPTGPVGVIESGELTLLHRPLDRPAPLEAPADVPPVAVVQLGQGDDAAWLDAVPAGAFAGLVVAGVGSGHVAADAAPRLGALVDCGIPVVVATRIPRGGTSRDLYDYPGSEVDLIGRGCVMARRLSAAKARLLLQILLANGAEVPQIEAAFGAF